MKYFVCDRQLPCNTSDLCGGMECNHTSDANHALYATHFDFNHSGRDQIEVIRNVNDRFKQGEQHNE